MPSLLRRPSAASGGNAALPFLLPLLLLAIPPAQPQPSPSSNGTPSNYYAATSFNPLVVIVTVVLTAAFFVLGFCSIYFRRCGDDTRPSAGFLRGGLAAVVGRSRRHPRGLDAAVIATFPTLVYAEVKELRIGKGVLECAVCLSEFADDEALRLLPKCSHAFHTECIDTWLASHSTCPVCRCNLAPDSADPTTEGPIPSEEGRDQSPVPLEGAVGIDLEGTEEEEAAEIERIGSQRREARSRSRRWPMMARFPRSHSTGHSLAAAVRPEEMLDRFTLRLPEHVRREIMAAERLKRTTSLVAFRTSGERSSRRGYRGGVAEGSSRGGQNVRLSWSDRWPSFFVRTFSAKVPAGRRGGEAEYSAKKGEGEGSMRGKLAVVKAPFDCLGGGSSRVDAAADEEEDEAAASGTGAATQEV